MSNAAKRSIARWIHIILGIPILGYIYSPFDQIPNYAVCLRSCIGPFGIMDVERPGRPTTFFERVAQKAAAQKGLPLAEAAQLK